MNRWLIPILLLAVLLALTNPDHSDFEHYVHRRLSTSTLRLVDDRAPEVERHDFALFSIYRLRLLYFSSQGREIPSVYHYIGVLKQFIHWK